MTACEQWDRARPGLLVDPSFSILLSYTPENLSGLPLLLAGGLEARVLLGYIGSAVDKTGPEAVRGVVVSHPWRGLNTMKLPAVLRLAAFLCALLLFGCGADEEVGYGKSRTVADQEMDGFTLTQTREGERVWSISAEHALVYEDADRVEMMTLRVDFFDDEGEVRVHAHSE